MIAMKPTRHTDWSVCRDEVERLRQSVDVLATVISGPKTNGNPKNDFEQAILIKAFVVHKFGIAPAGMTIKSREASIAWPRQVAMYLCREFTGLPLAQIGKLFGNRDHGTVLHATRLVSNRMATEKPVRAMIRELELAITGAKQLRKE